MPARFFCCSVFGVGEPVVRRHAQRFRTRGGEPRGVRLLATAVCLVAGVCLAGAASGCHGSWIQPAFRGPERILRTRHFRIVSDVSAASLVRLSEAAETMYQELDRLLPAPPGSASPVRELIAFRDVPRFKRYLGDHFFADGRAIGFYCDLGGEIALPWSEPKAPEDVRVLRHEVAHQHLAARLQSRLPAWFEEGLAERLALGAGLGAARSAQPRGLGPGLALRRAPAFAAGHRGLIAARLGVRETHRTQAAATLKGWVEYEEHRARLDAVFASLSLPEGLSSWDAPAATADEIPEPRWADGSHGYVLHLQFIRFIEEQTGALPGGALGAVLARARDGASNPLDLSGWFSSLGALDQAFHDYVRRAGLHALLEGAGEQPDLEGIGAGPERDALPALRCPFPRNASHRAPSSENLPGRRPSSSGRADAGRP